MAARRQDPFEQLLETGRICALLEQQGSTEAPCGRRCVECDSALTDPENPTNLYDVVILSPSSSRERYKNTKKGRSRWTWQKGCVDIYLRSYPFTGFSVKRKRLKYFEKPFTGGRKLVQQKKLNPIVQCPAPDGTVDRPSSVKNQVSELLQVLKKMNLSTPPQSQSQRLANAFSSVLGSTLALKGYARQVQDLNWAAPQFKEPEWCQPSSPLPVVTRCHFA